MDFGYIIKPKASLLMNHDVFTYSFDMERKELLINGFAYNISKEILEKYNIPLEDDSYGRALWLNNNLCVSKERFTYDLQKYICDELYVNVKEAKKQKF